LNIFVIVGVFLLAEGIGSILYNPDQQLVWQVGRAIRAAIGLGLIYFGVEA